MARSSWTALALVLASQLVLLTRTILAGPPDHARPVFNHTMEAPSFVYCLVPGQFGVTPEMFRARGGIQLLSGSILTPISTNPGRTIGGLYRHRLGWRLYRIAASPNMIPRGGVTSHGYSHSAVGGIVWTQVQAVAYFEEGTQHIEGLTWVANPDYNGQWEGDQNCRGSSFSAAAAHIVDLFNTPSLHIFNDRAASFRCEPEPIPPVDIWEWSPSVRETLCDRIDGLEVYIRIGDKSFEGTLDTLWVGFDGSNVVQKVAISPSAGFEGWTTILLGPFFEDHAPELERLGGLRLYGTAAWTSYVFGADEFKLSGLKLRANCFNSPIRVHYTDYSSINAGLKVGGLFGLTNKTLMYPLWNESLNPKNWTASPPCSHITQLTVTLEIEDKEWAGTYNSLYALIGNEKALIHHKATRKEVYTIDINLRRAFDQKIVKVDDLKELAILNDGTHDQVLPKSVNVRAICAGRRRTNMNVESEIKKWIPCGKNWTLSLAPREWNEF
ncbi:Heat-labile enterotoxin, A chain [Ophiocordyceps camponoti-floridani]|uniref:Heat-labile enterotoxin, A chain n=1 Tax=Ophiocordyceps camponoti-floridani TaxID=2030778 RepID=A0A8H4VCK0_9HYPO|nr:Heat-labile enterotoxin, A chain [Ophiocordyceps camponoti-floridani]